MPYTQLYRVKNFQNYYTLDMPGGTGTSTGTQTWTVVEPISNFPVTFPVLLEVWDTDPTFSSTVEFVVCTGANVGTKQLTISTRGVDGTSVFNHANGSKVAINIAALVHNNIIDNIEQLITDVGTKVATTTYNNLLAQGNVPITASVLTGEEYPATTTEPNGSGTGLSVTGPTILQALETGAVRSDGTNFALGGLDRFAVAFEASTDSGETHRVYLPGSIVTGFTGLIQGQRYYPSAAVPGGWTRTPGSYWRLAGYAISTTSMLLLSSISTLLHTNVGSAGTTAFNTGTSNFLSRADHEHKVYYEFCPLLVSPFAGQTTKWFANKTPLTYDVVSFYAVTDGAVSSSGSTVIRLEKTSQADINGSASGWSSMNSVDAVIATNQRSTEGSGSTNGTLSVTTLAAGEHLRARVISLGSGIGDISIIVVLKLKNTN